MIEYFRSSPEATASLFIFALGLLGSTCYLLYSLFVNYPVIIRQLYHRSLVSVDTTLGDKVKVTFEHLGKSHEIHELRQTEFEIFNSNPKQHITDKTITINFASDKVTILGVTAANIDNQTPELGGRKITTKVEFVPAVPPDLLLGTVAQAFYPVLVVYIPYLNKITENDRIFLRITYNGPDVTPQVQGAKFKSANNYYIAQKRVIAPLALGGMLLVLIFRLDVLMFVISFLFIADEIFQRKFNKQYKKMMRTLPNPLIPPPYEVEDLTKLYFHDTMS